MNHRKVIHNKFQHLVYESLLDIFVFAPIIKLAQVMTYEGGVTSVNVVSAVSLKTRVIGAEMEHPGQS